ncbi:dihydroorotase signature 1 [Trichococcus palustris]|uniref:Dihydroorotase n=1 Tax=Trichococcus palustris TaxID=140314 RepID=A0A143YAF7_9LACT|nr:dihydroorotase [Trichococcus palustris]CZQ85918.1 dihydroorotase signature 1 [Trichococcus palustris]SFK57218.1 dihydroorotase [Trichococcus palustris]
MSVWIKNAKMLSQKEELIPVEVFVKGNKIAAIGNNLNIAGDDVTVIDAKGGLITPGLVDVHVHLREPGFEYKETIETGSKAAARGGFTTVCAMPNLNPVPDTVEKFQAIQQLIKDTAVVHVLQYAPITEGLRSDVLSDQPGLLAAGAFAFTNDGVGVQTAGTMYLAMQEAAKNNATLVAHTEDDSLLFGGVMHEGTRSKELNLPGILSVTESSQIARDILLAEATGCHYHVCHVSTKESVRVIRDAKRAGIHVTAEVAPHHLILIDGSIPSDTAVYKMNPPLRGAADRAALIEGLLDGTIDCIATDHAPHSAEEKNGGMVGAPFGIVGSETAFQLLYTNFVQGGVFTLKQLVDWLTIKPASVFGMDCGTLDIGAPADIAIFDLDDEYEIRSEDFQSKSTNTPFIGWKVKGETLYTLVDGKIVYSK